MAAITLDRSRHFSQIFGQTENGAIFHQDGIDFRGDGSAILSDEDEKRILAGKEAAVQQAEVIAAADKPARKAKAKAEDSAPVDEELA